MAFDNLEDFLKAKNITLPLNPTDPVAKTDEKDEVKPFGNTPVDPLTGNPMYGTGAAHSGVHATIGDQHSGHRAIILKRSFADGKVKIYEDARGLAERTEMIIAGQGKIITYKDTDLPGGTARYKKIEVYSLGEELLGTINLYPKDKFSPHPVYRFFYEQSEIGTGNGDVALFIAQVLVSRTIQARSGAGTSLDGEIITTIRQILQIKR